MLSVSGCRGIVGDSLTDDTIRRYVRAFSGWLRERSLEGPVVLACDGRRGGDALRAVAGDALQDEGWDVIDIGVATTPTVGVLVRSRGGAGGLTLTASHNPAEWNGLKPIDATGAAPHPEDVGRLIELFHADDGGASGAPRGSIKTDPGAASVHVGVVLEAIERVCPLETIRERRFGVVVDSVNASGAEGARELLEALGCELTHLHATGSGVFPHTPEPTADNLRELTSEITKAGADIGFAQDPDADRLAIIDAGGRYVGEEYTLVLACRAMLEAGAAGDEPVLAANLSTSRMIDDVAASLGARVERSAVGEANVVRTMRGHACVIGGEGNGGVIWRDIVDIRDSLGSMALVLALMARTGKGVAALVDEQPAYAIAKRKAPLPEGMTVEELVEVSTKPFASRPDARVSDIDGVRVDFEADGGEAWIHVRPSNTEPIVRLIAEAPTSAGADAILDEAAGAGGS